MLCPFVNYLLEKNKEAKRRKTNLKKEEGKEE